MADEVTLYGKLAGLSIIPILGLVLSGMAFFGGVAYCFDRLTGKIHFHQEEDW